MVYKYKRRSDRGNKWTEESMRFALQAVQNGDSIRSTALSYNIPFSTLLKHTKSQKTCQVLGRFRTVFSTEEELEFVDLIKQLDSRFYGLTRKDLCELAYQFAEKNRREHPFRRGKAGPQWYYNFMLRHPELSLRTPEPTSIARARGFNKVQVQRFFDNLKKAIQKHNIALDNIYNVDETGIQTSSKRPPKVISMTGKKQVGSIASSERGTLITALFCCSAVGNFIPPTLVFPRKKRNPRYMEGTPPGTLDLVTDSGWITSEAFLKWMQFFVEKVRPTENQKCLLILDNHTSHRSIDVLDYASQNHVVLLSVPPHTTHKTQPLDVAVYGPFGTYFQYEIDKWQKSHPAQHVTFFDVGKIFCEAYLKAATPINAIKGFEKSGIARCDIDVFTDVDFLPADVTNTDINDDDLNTPLLNNNIPGKESIRDSDKEPSETCDTIQTEPKISQAGPSSLIQSIVSNKGIIEIGEEKKIPDNKKIKLLDIHIIPKCEKRKQQKTKRETQKSEILTDTPIKEEIRAKSNTKRESVKRKIGQKKTDDSKKLLIKIPRPASPPKIQPSEEDTLCLICGDNFKNSRPGEDWVQCNICENWAHVLCTDFRSGIYFCDNCRVDVLCKRS